jgi:hypothetical protein
MNSVALLKAQGLTALDGFITNHELCRPLLNELKAQGLTALLMASGKGDIHLVQALLKDGRADLNMQDETGSTVQCSRFRT